MKLYQAFAAAVGAEGIDTAFGLVGDGNLPLWAGLAAAPGLDLVAVRHEAAAVAMADGYHRASGRVGLATTTWGPGLTHVATPLTVAARARSALVVAIGSMSRTASDQNQSVDHQKLADLTGAALHPVTSLDSAAAQVAEAFFEARTRRRPVILEFPLELQSLALEWEWAYRPSTDFLPPAHAPLPPAEALAVVAQDLARAQRPVLVAGRGARAAGAREEILALAQQCGALLATTLPLKDWFSGEAWDLGIAGSFASRAGEALLAEADYVLGVGAELGYYTTEGGLLFPQAEVARIDLAPAPPQIGVLPGKAWLCGDARATCAALREQLAGPPRIGWRTDEVARRLQEASAMPDAPRPADGLDPRRLMQHLSTALPDDVRVVIGTGHFRAFAVMYLALSPRAQLNVQYQFGPIGQATLQAIGFASASPRRPTVLVEGDGSLMQHVAEIDTAVRHRIPLVLVVMNDGGLGAEVHKLQAKGFDGALAQVRSPDFAALARSLGARGVRLEREQDIAPAVQEALRSGEVVLVDAPVSPTVRSDVYARLHFGQESRAPRLVPAMRRPA